MSIYTLYFLGELKMKNKKILFLQCFGILLVVLGHSGENIPFLTKWIYSFHMPLFIFISGYLLDYTSKNGIVNINYKIFIKKKIIRLLIPYIVISSLAYIPKYILGKFAIRPLELSLSSYIHGFLYPWDNPIIFFWFLPTLFFIMLITIFLIKSFKNNIKIILIISLVVSLISKQLINIQFLNINGILNYMFFFVLGIFYKRNEIQIDEKIKLDNILITFVLNIILLINCIINYKFSSQSLYIFIALIGILFSISLEKIYSKNNYKFLNHLYGKSYSIYLLSWFPQVFIRIIGFQILKQHWSIVLPFSFIFGVYVPYIANILTIKLTDKYKKLNFLKILFGV